jgi:hypothetical protein
LAEDDPTAIGSSRQQEACFVAIQEGVPSPLVFSVYEALNILEKIDLFRAKSSSLKSNVNSSGTDDASDVVAELREDRQEDAAGLSGSHKFQALLGERYGFH